MRTTDHPAAHGLISTWKSLGLSDVVISTGSRNAPLVLAAHAAGLRITVALDERSAAHIALGMALESGTPCCAISTSGTAALNHGPALAEAYYMGVPLISVTADRARAKRKTGPGQMVVQNQAFKQHTTFSLEVDELDLSLDEIGTAAEEAWMQAQSGPVHVNVPFQEPLYSMRESSEFPPKMGLEHAQATNHQCEYAPIPDELVDWLSCHDPKVLILLGAVPEYARASEAFETLKDRAAVIADAFGMIPQAHIEPSSVLMQLGWDIDTIEDLRPDVVITCGLPPMDKKWREHLVGWNLPHWHIGKEEHDWDMFYSKSGTWEIEPQIGVEELLKALPEFNAFASEWNVRSDRMTSAAALFASASSNPWTDWHVYERLASRLDENASVHFANSTSARYAQWFDWKQRNVHANRGVAGIDGCLSTAVGDALANSKRPVVLLTGDTAWQYDANGLAVRPVPSNLKVIVINNGGGNIFRWIDGPEDESVLTQYFEAPFAENMKASAQHLGLSYTFAANWSQFEESFAVWHNNTEPSLLEIKTDGIASVRFFKALQAHTIAALTTKR
jgi:2-succinyl-5-enolpyruvyl-6-hydroxy-3-cyclohexene-1-carboxylate synthase